MDSTHTTVNHSEKEFVRREKGSDYFVTTNGCESSFGTLKNNIGAVFHRVSNKHIHRYLGEASSNRNRRELDTEAQMGVHVAGMVGKRLRYEDLIAKTPEELAEIEAQKARDAAIRRELVDREFDVFKRIYHDTDGMPPLPMVNTEDWTEI